jgi:hypothetical protein
VSALRTSKRGIGHRTHRAARRAEVIKHPVIARPHVDGAALAKAVKSQLAKVDGEKAIHFLKDKPSVAVVIAGGLGFAAANALGVGELAIAMAAGYAAYRALTA